MLREGVQECEARILIDQALLEGKITGGLKERCRRLLNERDRAMVKGFNIKNPDNYRANFVWYCSPAKAGEAGVLWHAKSNWQKRSEDLFTAAGEVARKLDTDAGTARKTMTVDRKQGIEIKP